MCGIAGLLKLRQLGDHEGCLAAVRAMSESLAHRGPDDDGVWSSADHGIYLAHRRLSIIDLSKDGRQPMVSSDGSRVIVYNGEIYNYRSLRQELLADGVTFRGNSDTEILVNGIMRWGVHTTLTKAIGMFAFALWDRVEGVLTLARDRFGEKPLYYGFVGGQFAFASELKALRCIPGFDNPINRDALASFMRFSYVPTPYSIFDGIYKLLPGTTLTVTAEALRTAGRPSPLDRGGPLANNAYWNLKEVSERLHGSARLDQSEAVDELDRMLTQAVERQLVADVPLGAMLSGGIDSSTIVSLMQKLSERPVKTFTIGFHEHEYNEATYAGQVARHLGTDHTDLYLTSGDALEVVPKLPQLYDEPFADSSQIPTHLVAQLARSQVTVALSGDGGDELFGGYTRYLWADDIWRATNRVPSVLRRLLARGVLGVSRDSWLTAYNVVEPLMPRRFRQRNAGEKVHTLGRLLSEHDREALYLHLVSHWTAADGVVPGTVESATVHTDRSSWPEYDDFVARMMYIDATSYLPDDILTKLDRATMAVGLESRVPFLDHSVAEFAFSIPMTLKIKGRCGKWILRKVLERYVPEEFIDRPKMGFGVPISEWLKGPLRDWAEALLDPSLLHRQGFLDAAVVQQRWEQHLANKGNWQYHLWDILMFQAWLCDNENGLPPARRINETGK